MKISWLLYLLPPWKYVENFNCLCIWGNIKLPRAEYIKSEQEKKKKRKAFHAKQINYFNSSPSFYLSRNELTLGLRFPFKWLMGTKSQPLKSKLYHMCLSLVKAWVWHTAKFSCLCFFFSHPHYTICFHAASTSLFSLLGPVFLTPCFGSGDLEVVQIEELIGTNSVTFYSTNFHPSFKYTCIFTITRSCLFPVLFFCSLLCTVGLGVFFSKCNKWMYQELVYMCK